MSDRGRTLLGTVGVVWMAGLLSLGCTRSADDQPGRSALAVPAEPRVEVPVLRPGPSPLMLEEPEGLLWRRAEEGDPLDLQRLANREGVVELLHVVRQGNTAGIVALRALGFSEDGPLALEDLCLWLPYAEPPERQLILETLEQIAQRPVVYGEELAVRGRHRCLRAVQHLDRGKLTALESDRVSAISKALAYQPATN